MKKKLVAFITHPIWHITIGEVPALFRIWKDWTDGKLQSMEEVELIHAEIDRNELRAEFKHPYAVKLMAMSLADSLDRCPGATNYLEICMESERYGPLLVTLQRRWGKTPGQLHAEAKIEVERAKEDRNKAALQERKKSAKIIHRLCDMVRHIDIHSSYPRCGYKQMTTDQKQLFCEITNTTDESNMRICTQ